MANCAGRCSCEAIATACDEEAHIVIQIAPTMLCIETDADNRLFGLIGAAVKS